MHLVNGDGKLRSAAVSMIEERLKKLASKITLRDMIDTVRTPEITRDSAGYGQVAHLRKGVRRELGVLWTAPSIPTTSPFIPYHLGVVDVPPEFKKHRYLTEGAASSFLDPDYLGIESTRYANR